MTMTAPGRMLAAAAAYAILGSLGLVLAIPPGYASPVFPAAGLAVALVLLFGNRILPGIWLGSLTINLAVAFQNGALNMVSATVAAMLALGAALQAWLACVMVTRRLNGKWRSLDTEKHIVQFLVLAGPLACLVAATNGVSALYVAGVIPLTEYPYSWWNWWIGDTLGVLVFAPLTLIFMLRRESPWKERQTVVAAPLLVTICLVISLFLGVARWERKQQGDLIAGQGQKLAQLLERRIVAHEEAIAALSRLIEVTPDMSYRQFDHFTRITLKDSPDIFALSYNPFIRQTERQAFEASMAKKYGVADFVIRERNSQRQLIPAARRPYYVAVGYIAPLEGNGPAVGFDINSEPVRREAIARAMASGKPAVTAPISLVQENQKRVGLLFLHPAYRSGGAPSGSVQPELIGFAVGVIKVDEMVTIATRQAEHTGIVFHLTDPLADADRRILYQSDGGAAKPAGHQTWNARLKKADRIWNLDVFPTAEFLRRQRSWIAWSIGIAGLVFAALLQVLLLAMTGRTAVIHRKVREQTLEIREAKAELELLNLSLQQRVDESVAELRKKDQMLINQGRQAAMGEVIGNIAHQWRQPLNALSMLIANLQYAWRDHELTEESLNEAAATANRLIQKMSATINDFRNFFRPGKEKEKFFALRQIRLAVQLVETAFKNDNIEIFVHAEKDCALLGFPNEYSQVLINILNNARDAILAAGSGKGRIDITLRQEDGREVVTIRDNGGGIPENILDKIFDPYFSTKHMGTGIGLYMSKMIIERNMNGMIKAYNIDGGCEFAIYNSLEENKS